MACISAFMATCSTIQFTTVRTSMPTELVLHSLAISQVMLNYATERGVDLDTCLSGTEISVSMLQDADALITPTQEMQLIENLMLALPDIPALGFEVGMQYNVATFGTWGFALRTSRHLRDAVERAIRYIPLSTAYCTFTTASHASDYYIYADPSDIPIQLRQFLLERDLGTAVNIFRELNLRGQSLRRLDFAGLELSYADRIRELAGIPVQFACKHNALVLKLDDINAPLPTFDEHLVRLLEDQCRQLMARRQLVGAAGQVRQRLLGKLGLVATLEEVAADLNLSPRSLRRKLESEGNSFRSIVEDARQQLATQLLRATDMKLEELSSQLGYADTASFNRAFRRWHGVSPGQFRTQSANSSVSA